MIYRWFVLVAIMVAVSGCSTGDTATTTDQPADIPSTAGQNAAPVQDDGTTVGDAEPSNVTQSTDGVEDGSQEPVSLKDKLLAEAKVAFESEEVDRGIELVQQAHQAAPDDRELIFALGRVQLMRAMQLAQDNRQQSFDRFLAAATLLRQLRDRGGELEPTVSTILQLALYNESCVFALTGKTENALASLQEAIDAGFEDLSVFDEDGDLASLRDNPQFQAMVSQLRTAVMARLREEVQQSLAENEPFPFTFQLPDLAGKTVSHTDFPGKLLIVDFWGTWCPPCRQEIPHFVKLQQTYGDRLQIVGINYEHGPKEEWHDKIAAFVAENGITYPIVIGDEATQQQVPDLEGFPTTLFLDASGTVRLKLVGYRSYEHLEAVVLALLEEPPK